MIKNLSLTFTSSIRDITMGIGGYVGTFTYVGNERQVVTDAGAKLCLRLDL